MGPENAVLVLIRPAGQHRPDGGLEPGEQSIRGDRLSRSDKHTNVIGIKAYRHVEDIPLSR